MIMIDIVTTTHITGNLGVSSTNLVSNKGRMWLVEYSSGEDLGPWLSSGPKVPGLAYLPWPRDSVVVRLLFLHSAHDSTIYLV